MVILKAGNAFLQFGIISDYLDFNNKEDVYAESTQIRIFMAQPNQKRPISGQNSFQKAGNGYLKSGKLSIILSFITLGVIMLSIAIM